MTQKKISFSSASLGLVWVGKSEEIAKEEKKSRFWRGETGTRKKIGTLLGASLGVIFSLL